MGKLVLAGVCSCALCMVGQAFAVPYQFDGTPYEQKFEGVSWRTTSFGSNFGQLASNTIGWAASRSDGYSMSSYSYRLPTTTDLTTLYSGAPVVPGGTTSIAEKSIAITSKTMTSYIGICLANNTGTTITSADIGYTLELWTTPTGPISGAIVEYDVGQHLFNVDMANLWGTFSSEGTIDTFSFATGQAPGSTLARSSTISNLGWDPGETLAVRWSFPSQTYTNKQIVGLDNVIFAVPEPSSMLMATGVVLASLVRRQRSQR